MKTVPYFERCAEAALELGQQDISLREPGKELGRGGAFYVRTLGTATLKGSETYLAVKKPYTPRGSTYTRLLRDLSVYAFLDMYAPEVSDRLPLFVAGLCEQGKFEPTAILTEDVTIGGTLKMRSRPVYPTTLNYLTQSLAQFGKPEDIFDREELKGTLAVRIGADGAEKFIDTDPPSFIDIPRLDELFVQARELSVDGVFSITADREGPLLSGL